MANNNFHIRDGLSGWEIERHNGEKQIQEALEAGWEPFAVASYVNSLDYVYFRRFKKAPEPKRF